MKKTYENPMFQVVSIKKNDIVTASENIQVLGDYNSSNVIIAAPGVRDIFDPYDAGY